MASLSLSLAQHSSRASTNGRKCCGSRAQSKTQESPASAKTRVMALNPSTSSSSERAWMRGLSWRTLGRSAWIVSRLSSTSLVSLQIIPKHSAAACKELSLESPLITASRRGELTTTLTGTSRSHEEMHSNSCGFVAAAAGIFVNQPYPSRILSATYGKTVHSL